MTRQHFIEALGDELVRRHAHFLQGDLHKFVEMHWAASEDDPDVERWATKFHDAGHRSVTV